MNSLESEFKPKMKISDRYSSKALLIKDIEVIDKMLIHGWSREESKNYVYLLSHYFLYINND